ncbi:DUF2271 domain-containing protein [Lachnospiraceae bacterium ZAX-1]
MNIRKLIPVIATIVLLVSLSACKDGNGQSETPTPESGTLTVTFDFEKQSGYASNQFAVWIEDADGNLIKTLYATHFTANGGYKIRPDSIPEWGEKSGLATMTKSEVDAISGATPKAGTLSYIWDLTHANGDTVSLGEYIFFVEGSLRWKNRVLYSGIIAIGDATATVEANAEYFYEVSDNQPALSSDSPENSMVSVATASFVPAVNN